MLGQKLGQMLEKPCVRSRNHSFIPIIMKIGENVFHDEILDKVENGHAGSETRSQSQMLEKPCVFCRGHIIT